MSEQTNSAQTNSTEFVSRDSFGKLKPQERIHLDPMQARVGDYLWLIMELVAKRFKGVAPKWVLPNGTAKWEVGFRVEHATGYGEFTFKIDFPYILHNSASDLTRWLVGALSGTIQLVVGAQDEEAASDILVTANVLTPAGFPNEGLEPL